MNPIAPDEGHRRTVLCLSGHDPSGGAGLHADLLAIHAQQAHALSVPTVLTVQDTLDVREVQPVAVTWLDQAVRCLIDDIPIHALKIGLLGGPEQVRWAAEVAARLGVPTVVDPVLRAGGGRELSDGAQRAALLRDLCPVTTVLTPNAAEARRLAPGAHSQEQCAQQLLEAGCGHVLVTGGDEDTRSVINHWYTGSLPVRRFEWSRWPQAFRGAGCTLASTIAARLALGDTVAEALEQAQRWTHAALGRHYAVGHGRVIPGRA